MTASGPASQDGGAALQDGDDRERAPIGVLVLRGERVESRHRVSYAVADAGGRLQHAAGAPTRPVFPRSAVKPLQALALLESGAARRFALQPAEIALACASHGGEAMHVDGVRRWLDRVGIDPGALACGAHPPGHAPAAERLLAAGRPPGPLHNNCSGKHAGMLTLARHLAAPLAGYEQPGHPVQRLVARTVAEMAGSAALPEPAIDGCGIPTYPLALAELATAMARLGDPQGLSPARRAACDEIRAAMAAHPELVAGTGRPCTRIMAVAPGVVVKTGAEGVYAAALPERGLGIALKVEDGAGRAAPVALLALLEALGALGAAARRALAEVARPELRNHARRIVGRITPAPGWPGL